MWQVLTEHGTVLLIGDYPHGPLGGLAMTLLLSFLALALTFPAAVLVALARTAGVRALGACATSFVYAVRSLPLLMLLFWIYYFLPVMTKAPISAFSTILSGIVIYQTAYLSEVIRAAIEALPAGQAEAARSLGLPYGVRTALIVLPQALRNCIPGIVNQFITVVKETSLGYIIAFNELTYAATEVNSALLVKPLQVFAVLAGIYFAICFTLSQCSAWIEHRVDARA